MGLKWIVSYLSNHTQQVKIKNKIPTPLSITAGIPQGSIVGPILFLPYVNDIFLLTHNISACLLLYADDPTCIVSSDSLDTAITQITHLITLMHNWFLANRLKLNFSKTKFFILSKSCSIPAIANIKIDSFCINKTSFKLLGVYIDDNLSWRTHISHVCTNLSRAIAVIRKLRIKNGQLLYRLETNL